MRSLVRNCLNCEHGVFCDSWQELKCLVNIRRIYEPDRDALRCRDFKKDKRTEKPKCQCKTCLVRGNDENE